MLGDQVGHVLETITFVIGIGLSSVSVSDQRMPDPGECQAYLQAQATRHEMYLPKGSKQLLIRYKRYGTEYEVRRTCIEY